MEIGYYNVVYELLEELEKKVKVTLSPPPPGVLVGRAEVKKLFKIGKGGKVAGCLVTEGFIKVPKPYIGRFYVLLFTFYLVP